MAFPAWPLGLVWSQHLSRNCLGIGQRMLQLEGSCVILAVKALIFTDGGAEAQSAVSLVRKWVQGRIRTRISSSLLILGFHPVIPGFLL